MSEYSFNGLNTLCDCGFIRKSSVECSHCESPEPPPVVDLTGKKGRAPVSEWVRANKAGENWALHFFGEDWRACFLDFVVVGPDPEEKVEDKKDPFWVLGYPDHDFDEDYMEQSRLVDFLLPELNASDVEGVEEEEGGNLECKECSSHVASQGWDCSSCSAKIHSQCGVILDKKILCPACFAGRAEGKVQVIHDLFRTYRGKNMFNMKSVSLALDWALREAGIQPAQLLPCFLRACHAVLTKVMSEATQGDWARMQPGLKEKIAGEAWATARRTLKFRSEGKLPRANKRFYSAIAKTVDISLTFQTVNERIDSQDVQSLVLPNESSPEEDLEESQWDSVADVALSAHASVTDGLELLDSWDDSEAKDALKEKLLRAQRLAYLAHESAQGITSWEAIRARVNIPTSPSPPHPARPLHRFELEKVSGAGGHCMYRAVAKIVAEICPNSPPPSVSDLRNRVAVEALRNKEALEGKFAVGADIVALRALNGQNGQGEELYLLGKAFRFDPVTSFPYSVRPCTISGGDPNTQGYKRGVLVYQGLFDQKNSVDQGHYDLVAHMALVDGRVRKSYVIDPSDKGLMDQLDTFLHDLRVEGQRSPAAAGLAAYNEARRVTPQADGQSSQPAEHQQQQQHHSQSGQQQVTQGQQQGQEHKQSPAPSVEVLIHGIRMAKKKLRDRLSSAGLARGLVGLSAHKNGSRSVWFDAADNASAFVKAFNKHFAIVDGVRASLKIKQSEGSQTDIHTELKKLREQVDKLRNQTKGGKSGGNKKSGKKEPSPNKKKSGVCYFYSRFGNCKFGASCNKEHVDRVTNPHKKKAQFEKKVRQTGGGVVKKKKSGPQAPPLGGPPFYQKANSNNVGNVYSPHQYHPPQYWGSPAPPAFQNGSGDGYPYQRPSSQYWQEGQSHPGHFHPQGNMGTGIY